MEFAILPPHAYKWDLKKITLRKMLSSEQVKVWASF